VWVSAGQRGPHRNSQANLPGRSSGLSSRDHMRYVQGVASVERVSMPTAELEKPRENRRRIGPLLVSLGADQTRMRLSIPEGSL
jgi:hypothetical protein